MYRDRLRRYAYAGRGRQSDIVSMATKGGFRLAFDQKRKDAINMLLRSFLITSVVAGGFGLVLWLVSLITGDMDLRLTIVLVIVFLIAWFWVYQGMRDKSVK